MSIEFKAASRPAVVELTGLPPAEVNFGVLYDNELPVGADNEEPVILLVMNEEEISLEPDQAILIARALLDKVTVYERYRQYWPAQCDACADALTFPKSAGPIVPLGRDE